MAVHTWQLVLKVSGVVGTWKSVSGGSTCRSVGPPWQCIHLVLPQEVTRGKKKLSYCCSDSFGNIFFTLKVRFGRSERTKRHRLFSMTGLSISNRPSFAPWQKYADACSTSAITMARDMIGRRLAGPGDYRTPREATHRSRCLPWLTDCNLRS